MKLANLPFFTLEDQLTERDRSALILFVQLSGRKISRKTIQLVNLLQKVPSAVREAENVPSWLWRELFPKDKDDRNFRRLVRQAEDIYWEYHPYKMLNEQPEKRLLLMLETLSQPPFGKHFEERMKELDVALHSHNGHNGAHFLHFYQKEVLAHHFSAKQGQVKEKELAQAMPYLDCFYLLEKFKYALFVLQLSKIRKLVVPEVLLEEMNFLCSHHSQLIDQMPVLTIYRTAYRLNLEGETTETVGHWLELLERYTGVLPKEEARELYLLAGNFLIRKINTAQLSLEDLREAYRQYFLFNKLLHGADFLREGHYIPHARFQNVLGSALNTGEAGDIAWAETFLKENLVSVRPEERSDLNAFCRAAIHFYRRDYHNCMRFLERARKVNRFYYCDIKSLEARIYFECYRSAEFDDIDPFQHIESTIRTIQHDKKLSDAHKSGYLKFFQFLKEMFRLRQYPKPDQEQVAKLEATVRATSPVAQKKWLLEKVAELSRGN